MYVLTVWGVRCIEIVHIAPYLQTWDKTTI